MTESCAIEKIDPVAVRASFEAGATEGDSPSDAGAAERALSTCAKGYVHQIQAYAQLRPHFPFDGLPELRIRYAQRLIEIHGPDPRVERVFDPDVHLLLTNCRWVDATSFQPQSHIRRTISRLPAVLDPVPTDKGWVLKVNDCRLERMLSGIPPQGYEPIGVVRGVSLGSRPDRIEIARPHAGAQIAVLNGDCLPRDVAYDQLALDLPDVNRELVDAALAGAICANDATGSPPLIFVEGLSGSYYDAGLGLPASFLADSVQVVPFAGGLHAIWQRLAEYSGDGHRFIHIPEFAREEHRRDLLLQLTSVIPGNRQLPTPNRAAYFLISDIIPRAYRQSADLRRHVRLVSAARGQVARWEESLASRYGRKVDIAEWRSLSAENALIANSILTHAYMLCQRNRFQFDAVADELGLARIDEDDADFRDSMCRALYRHCRGETPGRQICEGDRYNGHHWIDALTAPCLRILDQLASDTEDLLKSRGRAALFGRLRRLDWPTMLGISNPPIMFEADSRSNAIRFCDGSRRKKGLGVFNEQLPGVGE